MYKKYLSNLNIVSFIFIFFTFFYFYSIFYDLYPVTSGDPAIKFNTFKYNSLKFLNGFSNFNNNFGLGLPIYSKSFLHSPYNLISIIMFFFQNKILAYSIVIYLHFLIFFASSYYLLKKIYKLDNYSISIFIITFIYSTSILNEYIYNGFASYLFIPIGLIIIHRFINNLKKLIIFVSIFLLLIIFLSNEAVVQYCYIYLFIYLIYLQIKESKNNFYEAIIFSCKVFISIFIIWLSLTAFYFFPFLYDHVNNIRSHQIFFGGGFDPFKVLLWFSLPFTSWIFINEKMITSGILTNFESLNGFISILAFQTFIAIIFIKKQLSYEKFHLFYSLIFLFLACLNNYIPLFDYVIYLIKGTGWWRSLPLYIFSSAIVVAIGFNKLTNTNQFSLNNGVKVFIRMYSATYFLLSFFVLLFITYAYFIFKYDLDHSTLKKIIFFFSSRNYSDLNIYLSKYYLNFYYFKNFFILILCAILLKLIFVKIAFKTQISNLEKISIIFCYLVFFQTLNYIYYPMNSGINQNNNLKELNFFQNTTEYKRILIVDNSFEKIDNYTNLSVLPEFEKQLFRSVFPEVTKYQSNNLMDGLIFLNLGNISVYNKGGNNIDFYSNKFHENLIEDDSDNFIKFKTNKGTKNIKLINNKEIELMKKGSITHILSSLPQNNNSLIEVFKGDKFYIYEIINTEPFIKFNKNAFSDFKTLKIDNGFFKIRLIANMPSNIIIKIAKNKFWQIKINNKIVDQLEHDYFIKFRVDKGFSEIVIKYDNFYFNFGIWFSLLSFILFTIFIYKTYQK